MAFSIADAARAAKRASRQVAQLSANQKRDVLLDMADKLQAATPNILIANEMDRADARKSSMDAAMLDRLRLNPERIKGIADAVRAIAEQPDPVGKIHSLERMPSDIQVGKMCIPLGVVAMIYESRPNVTIDAAALCIKSGNAVILRGGKEALQSNLAIAKCIHSALKKHQLDEHIVTVVPDTDRQVMQSLMTLHHHIDLVIPRGGEGLIRFVTEHSQIPVIQHFKGVCHLFVDADADVHKALAILENGKTQRTGVCNALETLLVDSRIAEMFLPLAAGMLAQHQVKVHACPRSLDYFQGASAATEADWQAEYLALELAVKVVENIDEAMSHIGEYGSGHTEVIVTEHYSKAQQFLQQVDAAVVMVNASSRFSDGGELGLGAEIGISTSKLHAYGPMGAAALTTEKFIVLGDGQIRA